jgi:hypothetical protein
MKFISVTVDSIEALYNRFGNLPGNPMYHGEDGKEFFKRNILSSFAVIDLCFGMARVTDYHYGHTARLHVLFDKNPYDHIEKLREGLCVLMNVLHILRLEVAVPRNRGIGRLLSKVGFTYEGLLRNHLYNGILCDDAYIYSVIKEDYNEPRFV